MSAPVLGEETQPGGAAEPEPLENYSISMDNQYVANGDELLAQGREAYAEGDYERARGLLREAVPQLAEAKDMVNAREMLAFIAAAFGDMESVYSEFAEALKADPAYRLDQDEAPPRVYESFLKAKDEVVREGTLVCNCDPSGAEVYLDGVLIGEAPVRKEHIKEGEHLLTLKKPGYEVSTGKIEIKKDVTLTVEDKMAEARGELRVSSDPPGAAVYFDGKDAGVTPLTIKRVNAGTHTAAVSRQYFERAESAIEFSVGEKRAFDARLERRVLLIEKFSTSTGLVSGPGEILKAIADGLGDGYKFIPARADTLCEDLKARGLEAGSLGFLGSSKICLGLEDSAVLSHILEREDCETAVAASLRQAGDKYVLGLDIYSLASSRADSRSFEADGADGLKAQVERFFADWSAKKAFKKVSIGALVVDRAGGGVEVIRALPGSPAAAAGITVGSVISSVDGAAVTGKQAFFGLLDPARKQKIRFTRGGGEHSAEVQAVHAPAEAPLDADGFLYNLALAELSAGAGGGLPALNLGNVYMHMGEYRKAAESYAKADTGTDAGVCTGTALYRMGEAFEKLGLWSRAASSYREAMLKYPAATLGDDDGPLAARLAEEKLREFYRLGLVRERWWL